MKVLLIGKENILRWLDYTKKAFEQEKSIKLETIATNNLGIMADINRNIIKAFSKSKADNTTTKIIEKKIQIFQPDLVFVISPFLLGYDVLSALASTNALKVGWIGDKFGIEHRKTAQLFDHLYVTDTGFIDLTKNYNFPTSSYLPLAVDTDFFHPKNNVNRNQDLIFVGAHTPERLKLIQQIEYSNIKIYGKSWIDNSSKNVQFFTSNINLEALVNIYQTSKYVLNIRHSHNVINGLNMRTFEAIACGSCILQDLVSDIELNFDVNEEIVVYNNPEELNELLNQLEKDSYYFNKVIEKGFKRVMSYHTYSHRINFILKNFG